MDEYLHWDRLCRVIGNGAPDAEVRQDLNHELRLLAEMFREVVGCNLVVVSNCGVWLDPKIVTVDARLFRDAACNGFAAMAQGDDKRAVRLFREAGLLYRGPFLPEDAGKIVHETRVELAELMAVVADALSRECRSSCSPLSTRKFSAAPSRIAALTT
jgi:DNA-binding SARP family transcriptional activator